MYAKGKKRRSTELEIYDALVICTWPAGERPYRALRKRDTHDHGLFSVSTGTDS